MNLQMAELADAQQNYAFLRLRAKNSRFAGMNCFAISSDIKRARAVEMAKQFISSQIP